jgi:nitrite reductase (NADH) small subunit
MSAIEIMDGWADVGTLADIPRLGARVVTSAIGNIALFRTADDELFALEDRCPHKGGPLSQGIVHGKGVSCPLHNWVIDLETGSACAPDHGCTKVIEVRRDGERILLRIPRP